MPKRTMHSQDAVTLRSKIKMDVLASLCCDIRNLMFDYLNLPGLRNAALVCNVWSESVRQYHWQRRNLALPKVNNDQLTAAAAACQSLAHIDLEDPDENWFCHSLTTVSPLAKICGNLRSINLFGCYSVSSSSLIEMFRAHAGLESINLAWCRAVTDELLIAVAKYVVCLKELNLSNLRSFSDSGLCAVVAKHTALTSLNLGNCNQLTGTSFGAIAAHLPLLRSLNLNQCYIDDTVLIQIVRECRHLTKLGLAFTSRSMMNRHKDRDLTKLGIGAIRTHCTNLKYLDLSGLKYATDTTLGQSHNLCDIFKVGDATHPAVFLIN